MLSMVLVIGSALVALCAAALAKRARALSYLLVGVLLLVNIALLRGVDANLARLKTQARRAGLWVSYEVLPWEIDQLSQGMSAEEVANVLLLGPRSVDWDHQNRIARCPGWRASTYRLVFRDPENNGGWLLAGVEHIGHDGTVMAVPLK